MTVTIDTALVEELDRISVERQDSRSRVVEEAVKTWVQGRLEQELIEGYQAMNQENQEAAEANLSAGFEALK